MTSYFNWGNKKQGHIAFPVPSKPNKEEDRLCKRGANCQCACPECILSYALGAGSGWSLSEDMNGSCEGSFWLKLSLKNEIFLHDILITCWKVFHDDGVRHPRRPPSAAWGTWNMWCFWRIVLCGWMGCGCVRFLVRYWRESGVCSFFGTYK